MDKIFLVFSYNHFTGDKQETELNWNPKRGGNLSALSDPLVSDVPNWPNLPN